MTKIKLCGLSRNCDIEVANLLHPDYIGFVFAPKSKRYVSADQAMELKKQLLSDIRTVGVFVDEDPKIIIDLSNQGIIDVIQLHGKEDNSYIQALKDNINIPIIQAFRIEDIDKVNESKADYVLLDSGAGSGEVFDWELIQNIRRPYFLAGGLTIENVSEAIEMLNPYGVDVSSGIETDGLKDKEKMTAFVKACREVDKHDKS
ncbi:MAG: phosphoribosylanthranilate isomerase [Faecalicoccus sp.]|nr:phosphoribosylanthranilate isomerase [Faecalicoccus sp.]